MREPALGRRCTRWTMTDDSEEARDGTTCDRRGSRCVPSPQASPQRRRQGRPVARGRRSAAGIAVAGGALRRPGRRPERPSSSRRATGTAPSSRRRRCRGMLGIPLSLVRRPRRTGRARRSQARARRRSRRRPRRRFVDARHARRSTRCARSTLSGTFAFDALSPDGRKPVRRRSPERRHRPDRTRAVARPRARDARLAARSSTRREPDER